MTLRLATSSPPPAAEQPPVPFLPAASAAKPAGIAALVRAVDDLPALPEVAIRVARLSSEDASGSTHAVAEAISADPALAARMLRLANSAYYGVPRRIGTIREALLVLGLRTVRAITLAAAVHPALKGGGHWQHGISAAVIAEMLARRTAPGPGNAPHLGHVSPDEAFVAGLLHDVGKVAIASVFAPAGLARRFGETLLATGQPTFVAERALLGFDHAEAGGALAEKWNLPGYLVDAVRWHHDPLRAGHGSAALAVLAHAASALSHHVRPGDAPAAPPPSPLDPNALGVLGLPADLDVLADDARAALDSAAPLFALGDAPTTAPAALL